VDSLWSRALRCGVRWTARWRFFDAARGVQPPIGNGLAPGDKYHVRCSRSSTRWIAPARISRTPSKTDAPAVCAAHPWAIQCPIGKEDLFIGVIDFLGRKAIIWLEETLGAEI